MLYRPVPTELTQRPKERAVVTKQIFILRCVMVRLFFVYAALLVLMVCASSGVLGATEPSPVIQTQTSKISLESLDLKKDFSKNAVFGAYYYDVSVFKGDFTKEMGTLQAFLQERKKKVDEFNLENKTELSKLKVEHQQLMVSQTNLSKDETNDAYSKWSVSMYNNIGRQALLKQGYQEKIGKWDKENYILVKSILRDGKRYIAEVSIKKNMQPSKKVVASIR